MKKFAARAGRFIVSQEALEKQIGRIVLTRLLATGAVSATLAAVLEAVLR